MGWAIYVPLMTCSSITYTYVGIPFPRCTATIGCRLLTYPGPCYFSGTACIGRDINHEVKGIDKTYKDWAQQFVMHNLMYSCLKENFLFGLLMFLKLKG